MYVKLFSSLYQGTLRGRSDEILVFTNLLAHADQYGIVDKHWRAISEETGLSRERVDIAIINLEAPDPESRSPEMDGCRIVRLDDHRAWGWKVVNYGKYRSIRNEDDRKEQNRQAQERWRNKNKITVSEVSHDNPPSSQAEAKEEELKSTTLSGESRHIAMTWDFIAGFIDGEANLRLNKYDQNGTASITARITIYNTNLTVLEEIQKVAGGSISTRKREDDKNKDLHELNFKKAEVENIVVNCIKKVIIKREQMEMLDDFLKNWPHNEDYCLSLYERTKNLNARGKSDDVSSSKLKLNGFKTEAAEILTFLNSKTGGRFQQRAANIDLIAARLKDGSTVAECRQIIAKKYRDWHADENMAKYLRPKTLFNRTNFANYQGEIGTSNDSSDGMP